jgi:hypothetical protein
MVTMVGGEFSSYDGISPLPIIERLNRSFSDL